MTRIKANKEQGLITEADGMTIHTPAHANEFNLWWIRLLSNDFILQERLNEQQTIIATLQAELAELKKTGIKATAPNVPAPPSQPIPPSPPTTIAFPEVYTVYNFGTGLSTFVSSIAVDWRINAVSNSATRYTSKKQVSTYQQKVVGQIEVTSEGKRNHFVHIKPGAIVDNIDLGKAFVTNSEKTLSKNLGDYPYWYQDNGIINIPFRPRRRMDQVKSAKLYLSWYTDFGAMSYRKWPDNLSKLLPTRSSGDYGIFPHPPSFFRPEKLINYPYVTIDIFISTKDSKSTKTVAQLIDKPRNTLQPPTGKEAGRDFSLFQSSVLIDLDSETLKEGEIIMSIKPLNSKGEADSSAIVITAAQIIYENQPLTANLENTEFASPNPMPKQVFIFPAYSVGTIPPEIHNEPDRMHPDWSYSLKTIRDSLIKRFKPRRTHDIQYIQLDPSSRGKYKLPEDVPWGLSEMSSIPYEIPKHFTVTKAWVTFGKSEHNNAVELVVYDAPNTESGRSRTGKQSSASFTTGSTVDTTALFSSNATRGELVACIRARTAIPAITATDIMLHVECELDPRAAASWKEAITDADPDGEYPDIQPPSTSTDEDFRLSMPRDNVITIPIITIPPPSTSSSRESDVLDPSDTTRTEN